MEITELPPTPLVLPATGELFISGPSNGHLSGGREKTSLAWQWPWARKPKFSVNEDRSCAELAILHHLQARGWNGVWVNAFRGDLRTQWFPAPAARQLAEVGAPGWAVETFGRLRAANGGTLSGFFDVFAWRESGRAAFVEAKVGPDRIKPTQLRFVEIALRFRGLDDFLIVEIPGPSPHRTPARQTGITAGQAAARRLVTAGPRSGGRDLQPTLRRPASAGPGHDVRREQQQPRRAARWTADDVIKAVASSGDDAAAIARSVTSWAAGPHLRLAGGLHALGIPRLDRERDLSGLWPEIPLSELTAGHLDRLLALIDRWIADVRAHATEPETTTEE